MIAVSRWVPRPGWVLALWAVWLAVHESVAPGHLVTGAVFGWVVARLAARLVPRVPRVRSPLALAAYVTLVLWDIVVSAARVARLALGPSRDLQPRVVEVPLDVSDPAVVAILAATVTLTPGTLTLHADAGARKLEVHVLDTRDPAAVVAGIKHRYERRLKEVFAC